MEVKELQALITSTREARGFTTDPLELYALLNEEIGEIARELKKIWSPNYDGFDPSGLGDEVADSIVLLCALASAFDVDVESAVRAKFLEQDAQRRWPSAEL